MAYNTYLPLIIFFDSVKTPISSTATSAGFNNVNGYQNLTLEVKGATTINLTVEGCVNTNDEDGNVLTDAECTWTQLAVVNLSNYELHESILGNGIYNIGIGGVVRVRVKVLSITGTATITGIEG